MTAIHVGADHRVVVDSVPEGVAAVADDTLHRIEDRCHRTVTERVHRNLIARFLDFGDDRLHPVDVEVEISRAPILVGVGNGRDIAPSTIGKDLDPPDAEHLARLTRWRVLPPPVLLNSSTGVGVDQVETGPHPQLPCLLESTHRLEDLRRGVELGRGGDPVAEDLGVLDGGADPLGDPLPEEMTVSIDQPGDDGGAVEIDHLGFIANERLDGLPVADGRDHTVRDGHGFGSRGGVAHGDDMGVGEHQVGGPLRGFLRRRGGFGAGGGGAGRGRCRRRGRGPPSLRTRGTGCRDQHQRGGDQHEAHSRHRPPSQYSSSGRRCFDGCTRGGSSGILG